jgi:hypothetical protein
VLRNALVSSIISVLPNRAKRGQLFKGPKQNGVARWQLES